MMLKIGYRYISIEEEPMKDSGEFSSPSGVIKICTGLKRDIKQNTILHEVIHAIIDEYAICDDDGLEERIASCVANGLCQVVNDNHEFLRMVGWDRGGQAK